MLASLLVASHLAKKKKKQNKTESQNTLHTALYKSVKMLIIVRSHHDSPDLLSTYTAR